MEKGYTPLFEWVSPRCKIVLEYEKDNLVLTGIRHNITGEYIVYSELLTTASKFNIPVTESFDTSTNQIQTIQEQIKQRNGIEGFVIRFNNGMHYKVKTEWYFSKTKKDKQEYSFNSEANIWRYILEQQIDDALGFVTDTRLKEKLRQFQTELWDCVQVQVKRLTTLFINYKAEDKKHFVKTLKEANTTGTDLTVLYALYEGKDAYDTIVTILKKQISSTKGLETSREFLGGTIKWKE